MVDDALMPAAWQPLTRARQLGRLGQVILLAGKAEADRQRIIHRLTADLLCKQGQESACGFCAECQLVQAESHPDLLLVQPEKAQSGLKMEQIRIMQAQVQQTSQRSGKRIVVLSAVERMSRNVANALLKTLEEPPAQSIFILCADYLSTMLPTLLSRCQIIRVQPVAYPHWQHHNLLMMLDESGQAQACQFAQDLLLIYRQQATVTERISQWNLDNLGSLLDILYLIYAQILDMIYLQSPVSGSVASDLQALAGLCDAQQASEKIKKISAIQRNLSHNIHMNSALVLEELLHPGR